MVSLIFFGVRVKFADNRANYPAEWIFRAMTRAGGNVFDGIYTSNLKLFNRNEREIFIPLPLI